jgi:hypothetical protein
VCSEDSSLLLLRGCQSDGDRQETRASRDQKAREWALAVWSLQKQCAILVVHVGSVMQQLYMRSYFGNSGLIAHRSASLLAGFLCPLHSFREVPCCFQEESRWECAQGGFELLDKRARKRTERMIGCASDLQELGVDRYTLNGWVWKKTHWIPAPPFSNMHSRV